MRIGRINWYDIEHFEATKKMDLSFIEVCCNNQKDAERFIAKKDNVKANIAATGIDISCVGRWNHDLMENGKIDPEKRANYKALLEAAIEVGAKTFVCGANMDNSVSLYRNYINAVEFLGDLVEQANGRIKVAVQNCDWNNYIVQPVQWQVILGELPDLCIKYDASHAYNRHCDYLGELSDWGERIAHLHIKGTTHAGSRSVDDPPAGMDDLRWSSIFSILYARGYDGDLSIEPHSAAWQGERGMAGVAFTRDYIRQFIL